MEVPLDELSIVEIADCNSRLCEFSQATPTLPSAVPWKETSPLILVLPFPSNIKLCEEPLEEANESGPALPSRMQSDENTTPTIAEGNEETTNERSSKINVQTCGNHRCSIEAE